MLQDLQTWYLSLDSTMQMFYGCAIIASVVFGIQATLTICGMDHDLDMDFDTDMGAGDTMDLGGGLSLFSIRSLVNFFVGFGWAGVSLRKAIPQTWLLVMIAIIIGLFFGYIYIYMRRKLMRLEHNGAVNINDSIGKHADVYLRIPAQRSGKGKVQISLNGSVHEFDAMTDGEEIATHSTITITSVEGNILIVNKV